MCFLASKYDDILAISKQLTTNSCHTMLLPFNKAIHYNNRDSLVRNLFGSLQRVGYWQINVDAFLEFKASTRMLEFAYEWEDKNLSGRSKGFLIKFQQKGWGSCPPVPCPPSSSP